MDFVNLSTFSTLTFLSTVFLKNFLRQLLCLDIILNSHIHLMIYHKPSIGEAEDCRINWVSLKSILARRTIISFSGCGRALSCMNVVQIFGCQKKWSSHRIQTNSLFYLVIIIIFEGTYNSMSPTDDSISFLLFPKLCSLSISMMILNYLSGLSIVALHVSLKIIAETSVFIHYFS